MVFCHFFKLSFSLSVSCMHFIAIANVYRTQYKIVVFMRISVKTLGTPNVWGKSCRFFFQPSIWWMLRLSNKINQLFYIYALTDMYTCMRRLSVLDISCLPLRWVVVYKLWHCIYSIRSDLIRYFSYYTLAYCVCVCDGWKLDAIPLMMTTIVVDDIDDREWISILSFYYETL